MAYFDRHPELLPYLIPGTPNTYVAAILIFVEERDGGNIVVMNPEGELAASVQMSGGKVLCGRWARSLHCNEPLRDGRM